MYKRLLGTLKKKRKIKTNIEINMVRYYSNKLKGGRGRGSYEH